MNTKTINPAPTIHGSLFYICYSEGFLRYSIEKGTQLDSDGNTVNLIDFKGFTCDIRKATPNASRHGAVGIAKLGIAKRFTARNYYAVPSIN